MQRFMKTMPGTPKGVEVIGTSDTVTVDTAIQTALNLLYNPIAPAAQSAEHGAGVIGTAATPATYRRTENGVIITQFKFDLTGLASVATANDVIGLSAGGVAYLRQNLVATDGIVFRTEMSCLETPAGGDDDVNVVANVSALLEYDGAGGTTYGINGGDWVAGKTVVQEGTLPTANHYYYLAAGTGDTAAAYTAGQFIFTTYGHALLT